ncbi:multiple epidermal growth factor-like domains protein 10 isoform X3 [Mya arenaria]|uniref:multiple epidermal growth factor-like domains protein 10 isoform X3 n=1 Tax=Mya arenaria TaxID=6604 RepID=UPI0022E6517D|nr:multiple epidermal growth factor-like domains protein 10 isoform X3 [Mya arenaria]
MDMLKTAVLFQLIFISNLVRSNSDFRKLHITIHNGGDYSGSDYYGHDITIVSSDTSGSRSSSSDNTRTSSSTSSSSSKKSQSTHTSSSATSDSSANHDSSSGSSSSTFSQSTETSGSQSSDNSMSSSTFAQTKPKEKQFVKLNPPQLSSHAYETSSFSGTDTDTTKSCSVDSPASPSSTGEIGDDCFHSPYCKDPHAECSWNSQYNTKVCTCINGWDFIHVDGTGWICTQDRCEDTGCPSPKVCRDGKCVDDDCENTGCPSSMVCRNGKCEDECPPRTVNVNGECRSDQWGEACISVPDTCVEADIECVDGYCYCQDRRLQYSHAGHMCVGKHYGDSCYRYDDTCDINRHLRCIHGECKCPPGTTPAGDPVVCCDHCSDGQECCLNGVGCPLGKCHCKHGAIIYGYTEVCCDDCSTVSNSHCCTELEYNNGECFAGECQCDFEEASRYPLVCCPDCDSIPDATCCGLNDIACELGQCECYFETARLDPLLCCPDCSPEYFCSENGQCEPRGTYSTQCAGPGSNYPEHSCITEIGIACVRLIECGEPGLPSCDMRFCICDWTAEWRIQLEDGVCCNDNLEDYSCSNNLSIFDGSGDAGDF